MKMEIGSPIFKACQQVSIKLGKVVLLPGQWEIMPVPGEVDSGFLSVVLWAGKGGAQCPRRDICMANCRASLDVSYK